MVEKTVDVAAILAKAPPFAEKLVSMVNKPADIDKATKELGIDPRLLNYHIATPADLTSIGLGKTTYIPVQVSEREGGRKSLYFLNPGEETLAGLYVGEHGVMQRYVARLSGDGVPARSGDSYSERITTEDGEELFTGQGQLEVLSAAKGIGKVVLTHAITGDQLANPQVNIWVAWSCIRVEW